MKKLKLDLKDLKVESFETSTVTSSKGTVKGQDSYDCPTPGIPCSIEGCHTEQITCNTCDNTCPNTCANTCPNTCANTCPATCYSCVPTCGYTCGFTCNTECLTVRPDCPPIV